MRPRAGLRVVFYGRQRPEPFQDACTPVPCAGVRRPYGAAVVVCERHLDLPEHAGRPAVDLPRGMDGGRWDVADGR